MQGFVDSEGAMSGTFYLAQQTQNEIIVGRIGVYGLKFALVALGLYLAIQAIYHLPYLSKYFARRWGMLIIQAILLCFAGLIAYYQPSLRVLRALDFVDEDKTYLWIDVAITTLALMRASQIWHFFVRYLDRSTSG